MPSHVDAHRRGRGRGGAVWDVLRNSVLSERVAFLNTSHVHVYV